MNSLFGFFDIRGGVFPVKINYVDRYTFTCQMSTKTITISENAYERLKSHKRADETFTETILRLTSRDQDRLAGFGMLADLDSFRESVTMTRDSLDTHLRSQQEK